MHGAAVSRSDSGREELAMEVQGAVLKFQESLASREQELRAEAGRVNELGRCIQQEQLKTAVLAAETLSQARKFQEYVMRARWRSLRGPPFMVASRGNRCFCLIARLIATDGNARQSDPQ